MDDQKKKEILAKVEAGKKLTNKEYVLWLEIIGYSKIEAETVITIRDNKDSNVLID